MVVPASNSGGARLSVVVVLLSSPASRAGSSDPQAPATRARTTSSPAAQRGCLICLVLLVMGGWGSVGEDLGQEVPGPVGARVGEELIGGRDFHDAALVHEDDA